MAPFVARNGAAFEAIAVRQNARDNRFSFLKGGPGAEYYRWRVQASLKTSCTCVSSHICCLMGLRTTMLSGGQR